MQNTSNSTANSTSQLQSELIAARGHLEASIEELSKTVEFIDRDENIVDLHKKLLVLLDMQKNLESMNLSNPNYTLMTAITNIKVYRFNYTNTDSMMDNSNYQLYYRAMMKINLDVGSKIMSCSFSNGEFNINIKK